MQRLALLALTAALSNGISLREPEGFGTLMKDSETDNQIKMLNTLQELQKKTDDVEAKLEDSSGPSEKVKGDLKASE